MTSVAAPSPANDSGLPRLLVLYGSETGTAEDVAGSIQQLAFNRALGDTQVAAMDEFPVSKLLPQCQVVVFVVSTTGDGEPPENMRASWRSLLRRSLSAQWLRGVRFAVFGLGDSSYAKYNAVARKLHARLKQLGGEELVERGLGDDQHPYGYFGALNPWLDKLWPEVLKVFPVPEGFTVDDSPKPLEPKYCITFHNAESDEARRAQAFSPRDVQQNSGFYAPPSAVVNGDAGMYVAQLVVNRRITADDWTQDVRHLEFDLSAYQNVTNAEEPMYRAGDIAVVYPENTTGVDEMLQYVGLSGDCVISIDAATNESGTAEEGNQQHDLPSPTTLRDLLTKYLAILEIPRRSFFEKLSLFAADEEEVRSPTLEANRAIQSANERLFFVAVVVSLSIPPMTEREAGGVVLSGGRRLAVRLLHPRKEDVRRSAHGLPQRQGPAARAAAAHPTPAAALILDLFLGDAASWTGKTFLTASFPFADATAAN